MTPPLLAHNTLAVAAAAYRARMAGVHADLVPVPGEEPLDSSWKLPDKAFPYSCTDEEALLLGHVIRVNRLRRGFEVATAFGFGSLAMGVALKENGGRLVTMDCYVEEWKESFHYDAGELAQAVAAARQQDAQGRPPSGLAFARRHAQALGLENVIDFRIGVSPDDVAEALASGPIDLAFIDGGHFGDQPLLDFLAVCSHLAPKCAVFFHDNNNPTIALAVAEAERRLGTPARVLPTRWGLTLVGRGLDAAALDALVAAPAPPAPARRRGDRPVTSGQISVVVQGSITGRPGDPYEQRHTLRCLESVRAHLPGAQIVLSTGQGADVSGLPFDVLVENDDPGALVNDDVYGIVNNVNRQIVSSRAGLLTANRPFALKLRSDLLLTGDGFLRYFGRFPARSEAWRCVSERVLVCTVHSRNPRRIFPAPFHPSDFFAFGRREDVLGIWNVPLAPEPATSRWFESRPRPASDPIPTALNRYFTEQYVWLSFLRKHRDVALAHRWDLSGDVLSVSEQTLANNLVILSPEQLQIQFVKYRLRGRDWASLYTHGEWLRLYKKYCDASQPVAPDLERAVKPVLVAGDVLEERLAGFAADPLAALVWGPASRLQARSPRLFNGLRDLYRRLLRRQRRRS